MIVYGTASSVILLRKTPPSPYAKDIQTFYESGGEGLKAQN